MSNDDKILENDIQYMLRGCDPHDAEARRHIARCIIAYVREHDGRDAERYRVARRKVCIVGDSFHVINLRPTYVAPDAAIEFDAAIDAAIAKAGK